MHGEPEQAHGFYAHLIPEFVRSHTDQLHLLLMLKDLRCTLGREPGRRWLSSIGRIVIGVK